MSERLQFHSDFGSGRGNSIMDSSYKQKTSWMNSGGGNNGTSDKWGSFQSGRDSGPERSSLSLAGWSPYADNSRRPVASNEFSPTPELSGTRWSRDQSAWNEMRDGPQESQNSWSGPTNGDKWSGPRMMQQAAVQIHDDEPKGHMEGFLHDFNGAGRDWYYRYLEMGCSPEDARDRVLDRNLNHPESLNFPPPPGGRYAVGKAQMEHRTSRRPPPFRPETSSHDLNSLSGASRKWYKRHLENGFTPEEALAKVLEYKRTYPNSQLVQPSITVGGRKRPVDDIAREDQKKSRKGKEWPPAGAVSSNKNSMTVAIVAENHPDDLLQKQQLTKIENALVEEMKKGWTHSLNFGGIRFRPGMILVSCLDKASKQWLEMLVPKITAIEGVSLRIYKEDEIPGTKAITVFVPRTVDEPDEVTMGFLKDQNTDLSENWSVLRSIKSSHGKVMIISMGEKSLNLLNERGMSISYRFGQLSCRIFRGSVFSPRKRKISIETPKSPPEIDLTEEDGDMEISDMTVLDEVQCDDEDEEVCEDISEDEIEAVEEYDNEKECVNEESEL